jgi:dTDP-4-amino-4,6-dideoxygalactose transaminase
MDFIPFFNYPALFNQYEKQFTDIFVDVGRRGAYILQKDVTDFEASLAEYLNVKHVFGVADGTSAIIIGLKAAGIGQGDEVIMPSHTYIATAGALQFLGGVPVLADIGPDNMLDPDDIEHRITSRTKAICPVQINGRTCDMDRIQAIADKHGLQVIEDAAQALGARYKGRAAGTFGTFGTISFYPAKLLGCFGDGGAVMTNDDTVGETLSMLRDHGRNSDGRVVTWGINSRLDNLQAAILNFKFKHYEDEVSRRREIARQYDAAFRDMPEITVPVGPDSDEDRRDVYQNYEMAADRRDELRDYLRNERGIGTIIQWAGTPVHQFNELGFNQSDLPKTDAFFKRCLMLPMNVSVTDEQLAHVIASVKSFYKR